MTGRKSTGGVVIRIATPECDKIQKVRKESHAIGEFLEWYRSQKQSIKRQGIETVLARYFEIDLAKVEQERRAILKGLGAANDAKG